jgi:threonine synthase
LPEEFRGMLDREKRVVEVEVPDVELVKNIIREAAKLDEDNGGRQ